MERIVVRGGRRLVGQVRMSGSKDAALPILASSLLCDGVSTFRNVPDVGDVRTMARVLAGMGAVIEVGAGAAWRVDARVIAKFAAPWELVRELGEAVLVLGPLLARRGEARVALPGASARGAGDVEQQLRGLRAMGAVIERSHGDLVARARGLRGAAVVLDAPAVTATEGLMMAATLAEGRTSIENAARDPEVEELARVLNKMGARIQGAGTSTITIEGVRALSAVEHTIIPDRVEAGTFLVAGALGGGDVIVRGALPEHLDAVMSKLRHAGAEVSVEDEGLRVRGAAAVEAVDVTTGPYPGFPTEMRAQFVVLAARARGQSVITETGVASPRRHAAELGRLGADLHVDGRTTIIRGLATLEGAQVDAPAHDASAAAALVLAGLVAEGRSEIHGAEGIDRGFERFDEKLRALGGDVVREVAA